MLPWRKNEASSHGRSKRPEQSLKLDSTPTGEEEYRDFDDSKKARGLDDWNADHAKTRIDRIARTLAIAWTVVLVHMIYAQAAKTGLWLTIPGLEWQIQLFPQFHLGSTEFIAVVTTTTIAVFGFLVIVATHLFKK